MSEAINPQQGGAVQSQFRALLVRQDEQGYRTELAGLPLSFLGAEGVLVRVAYSSLNYKDALAITGSGKIIRDFPLIPGIDLAGTVIEGRGSPFRPGEPVLLTGWGVGERFHGGLADYARLRPEWLLRLPEGMGLRQSMALGTAGLTAMLCVLALEQHGVRPASGRVVVTGATGGVGSLAVAILARLGWQVVAVTGKPEQGDWLRQLGASEIVARDTLAAPARPLESESYAAAIDTAGGAVLAGLLPRMAWGACVAACGLAAGASLQTTVMPFILRGVTLAGVDSVQCPLATREVAWQRLAECLPADALAGLVREIGLEDVVTMCRQMQQGQSHGRVVVRLAGEG